MLRLSMFLLLSGFIAGIFPVNAQPVWTRCKPMVNVPIRWSHAIAYDRKRQRMVLFGGSMGGSIYNADTWEWDGNTWIQRVPKVNPSARCSHAMTYDSARERVVLFGGVTSGIPLNDTWEWDGTTWSQRTVSAGPPIMGWHAMVYDSTRHCLVVFGGQTVGQWLNQTWEFDGTKWSRYVPAISPAGRVFHAMAYDAARGRVVLFGGLGIPMSALNDTWEWDGKSWIQCQPTVSPPPRYDHSMAYDELNQRIVMFGGYNPRVLPKPQLNDTWEWDGKTWVQCQPAISPSGRYYHEMAYDTARHNVLLVGGATASGGVNETWKWGSPFILGSGSAGPGTMVALVLDSENDAGLNYLAGSSFGTGPIRLGGGRRIDLSQDDLFFISVSNQTPSLFSGYHGVLDGQGQAKAAINIPNIPALIGLRLHTAFVTLSPSAPSGIRSISNTFSFSVAK